MARNKLIDLAGERFGRWLVIRRDKRLKSCPNTRWLCLCDCGTTRAVDSFRLRSGGSKSCGCLQRDVRGPEHHSWTGGVTVKKGYRYVNDPRHPNADGKGYVAEHAKLMAGILGRPLHPGETVHHRNGVRDDNRPSNLELWASRHPRGERASDLVIWANDVLRVYGECGEVE